MSEYADWTAAVARAREAHREENHCRDCDTWVPLVLTTRAPRLCPDCKRDAWRRNNARGYQRRKGA